MKRMREEEIEKGDCEPPNRKLSFFEILSTLKIKRLCGMMARNGLSLASFLILFFILLHFVLKPKLFKGEVYPEMKLCGLLILVHCIHLPLILFPRASSGQSYNIDSPWCLFVVTLLTKRWLETLLRFEVFWTFLEMYSFDRCRLPVCLSSPYYACLVKIWRAILPRKLI